MDYFEAAYLLCVRPLVALWFASQLVKHKANQPVQVCKKNAKIYNRVIASLGQIKEVFKKYEQTF